MSEQRNIVFIQAESMDGRAMGYMAEPGAHTPNLDRLAARGAVFEQAYCNSPQCVPSRSSMWSGRYVWQVGAWNNYRGVPQSERLFTADLAAAGYHCELVGRTDHRSGAHSLPARMTAWVRSAPDAIYCNKGPTHTVNDNGRRQRAHDWEMLDRARDFLTDARPTDQPFFLYLAFINTHPGAGYNTSTYWLDRIDQEAATMPPTTAEAHPVMQRMQQTKGCDRPFDADFIRSCRVNYLAMIAEIDGIVGELMETLEAQGLLDETIVIFTADHGDMRLEHNQYLKNAHYEGSARVPMVMAGPGITPGHRVEQPVSLIDMYPTFMDISGGIPRHALSGVSLLPLAAGGESPHRGDVFSEYHSNFQQTGSFMLRRGPWKYLAHMGYRSQLFHLERDPDELDDCIDSEPHVAAEMDAVLRSYVDPEAADAAAKATDAAEFACWRLNHPGDSYLEAIGDFATHWDADIAARFAAWADSL